MKMLFSKCFFLLGISAIMVASASAQTKKKTTKKKPAVAKTTSTQLDPFGNPVPTNNQRNSVSGNKGGAVDPFGSSNGTKADTGIKKNQPAPYVVIPSKGGGNPLTDSVRPSLRNDNGIDESFIKDRTPLPYDHIREDDAIYKQRIWSVIDTREKLNLAFRNPRNEDNGSQLFFAILFKAIVDGNVTAFEDERFSVPISKERFLKDYAGGSDTVPFRGDLDNPDKITEYQIRSIDFPIDSIYQFQVKEDVIFDKEASRLVRRILGIAPMMPTLVKGKIVEGVGGEAFPKFWIYYPDVRPVLAKYRVYNGKNFAAGMSWEDLFESHMYSSYIVKSSLNNFRDQKLKDYINDPLFRLLEGEKIKEKIFNYEQDLWQY